MRIFFPIAKVDAEQREVWGYASTEAHDEQGEVVTRAALTAALGDYMKFANIREMHQLSAVGIAKEAGVDDKGLFVGAKIVDDQAWRKVVEGVYKGYSIGGRVTRRDPADHKRITGLVLHEISLVDRPANPEAVFDYWKAAAAPSNSGARFDRPLQIWSCGVGEHRHIAKAEALDCLERRAAEEPGPDASSADAEGAIGEVAAGTGDEPYDDVEYADPGYRPDGRKRYPIDTERHIRAAWDFIHRPHNAMRYTREQLDRIRSRIIAAWKAKIDPEGPPATASKAVCDPARSARLAADLEWLRGSLTDELDLEGDGSLRPARLATAAAELGAFLKTLACEEEAPILDAVGGGADPASAALDKVAAPAGDLAKALAEERAEKAVLIASLSEIVPRLDQLRQRVEDIAQTPLPPATLAKGIVSISKQQDAGSFGPHLSADDFAEAFARLSPEDQTLALIKASRARPIQPPGFPAAQSLRRD